MLRSRFASLFSGKILIAIALLLGFAGFRILLWPSLSSLYLQVRGGMLLEGALRAAQVDPALPCSLAAGSGHQVQDTLDNAIRLLNQAAQANPRNAQAYLLLGRAFCASGDAQQAIQAYQEYIRLRPHSPLGHVELAFAIAATGDQSLAPMLLADWKAANLPPEWFLESARTAFLQQRYSEAAQAYPNAWFVEEDLAPAALFQWAASAVIVGKALPPQIPRIPCQSTTCRRGR